VNFFNFSINKILTREQSILDQARIRLLYYGFLLAIVGLGALFLSVYLQGLHVLTLTAGGIFIAIVALFKYLTYKPHWHTISHLLLITGTLLNLAIVFVILQDVNIVTIQVIILIIVFSFYMLGQNWGMFFSLLNLLPILIFLVMQYDHNYFIDFKPEKADQSTTIIAVFANFILIIFIHSHFYTAFLKNIQQLKNTFAVIGMSNLLLMNHPRPDQSENLEILKFSANNLLAIVNDVLDFNKIESGKVVFEKIKFNLVELLQNICGGQMIKAEEKGLLFKLDIDSALRRKVIFGDPTRLTQMIFNLVSNAIKFTSEGNIWVRATCLEDRHNNITVGFSVKDSGIGIRKENLETIFEPFTQESITTTRQYGGTGLGLAIVKRLLELQGLQMHVSSKVNVGSEFSFNIEFPVSTEIVVPKERATETRQYQLQNTGAEMELPESSLRILIAEDNPVNVMLMKKLFSKWNIVPTIAENGERAVEILQYGNFDIVLMDLQMPVMNGFDASMEIRKMTDPAKSRIPIIALTASALFDIRDQVTGAGMNDYVAKPFKPDELMDKIQNLIATVG
jgi:signal transduction histidine kinase/CheY-like chemotaxis protein